MPSWIFGVGAALIGMPFGPACGGRVAPSSGDGLEVSAGASATHHSAQAGDAAHVAASGTASTGSGGIAGTFGTNFGSGGTFGDGGKFAMVGVAATAGAGECGEAGYAAGGSSDGACLRCNQAYSQSSLNVCPESDPEWLELRACLCAPSPQGCATECRQHALCSGVSGGGFTPECGNCIEAHCTVEAQACEMDF